MSLDEYFPNIPTRVQNGTTVYTFLPGTSQARSPCRVKSLKRSSLLGLGPSSDAASTVDPILPDLGGPFPPLHQGFGREEA